MTLHERLLSPTLDEPVMLVALDGWIDAGFGAAAAAGLLQRSLRSEVVARFDTDVLVDHRARRPVLRLADGVSESLTWPTIELLLASDKDRVPFLFLVGAEPDSHWHGFCSEVGDLASELGVRMILGLGAYPAGSPHTRPVRLSITANSTEVADRLEGFTRGTLDVPAGVQAAIELHTRELGIDAVGLWAQVPHYASAMPYPAAAAALLDSAGELGGLRFDVAALQDEAAATRTKLDGLVAQSDEHRVLVHELETAYDEAAAHEAPMDLLSGDELAAELQEYLRDQDGE